MHVTLRRAQEDDVEVLKELFLEFSGWDIQRSNSIKKTIKDPKGELLVAESNGKIIGFIHQVFYNDPLHAGTNSDITILFVKEENRKQGIATQLIRRALQTARKRRVIEVHVTTREDNERAIHFYERHGFKKEGELLENNPQTLQAGRRTSLTQKAQEM